jgi:hypothetical protein
LIYEIDLLQAKNFVKLAKKNSQKALGLDSFPKFKNASLSESESNLDPETMSVNNPSFKEPLQHLPSKESSDTSNAWKSYAQAVGKGFNANSLKDTVATAKEFSSTRLSQQKESGLKVKRAKYAAKKKKKKKAIPKNMSLNKNISKPFQIPIQKCQTRFKKTLRQGPEKEQKSQIKKLDKIAAAPKKGVNQLKV